MKKLFDFKIRYTKPEKEREWNSKKQMYEEKIVDKEYEEWNYDKIIAFVVIILFAIITLFGSFKTVKSGEIGLRIRFGKIVDSTLHEGVNFKIPYIEKIKKVNIKVQKSEETIESSTKDMQIVNTTVAVNFRIKPDKASSLYKTVGNNYADVVLQPSIKESIKTAIAKYNAEEITTKRNEVSSECLKAIQSKVEKYGIVIEDFNLTNFNFGAEYTKAIEEKQVAEQKLEKARLEAEQKVVEAEATRKANELLSQTITEKTLTEKFLEKWNGELPKVTSGNGIFNINDFIK